jgi:general secretion pathway protein J
LNRAARTAGFTLIEVLVALALMGLISTVLIASLEIGGHTWQRVTRTAMQTDEIARSQAFLRLRLATIHPVSAGSSHGPSAESLLGTSTSLEFVSSAPGSGNDRLLRYRIGPSSGGYSDIEVAYRPDRSGSSHAVAADWSRETLLAGAQGISIQFWESASDIPGRWVDHWEGKNQLPDLIRIEVSFASDDQRQWPPLYVEPKIDTSSTCAFDVVSRRCRNGT